MQYGSTERFPIGTQRPLKRRALHDDLAQRPGGQNQEPARDRSITQSVDVHCHCLPGIDDGPKDMQASMGLCRALVADGITAVIATPHQLGKYDLANSRARIERRLQALQKALSEQQLELEIALGADVRIDERLPKLIDQGEVLTARDLGKHLLLELPTALFCEPTPVISQLRENGIQCVMTHPERHKYLAGNLNLAEQWLRAGAVIQVTAGSLLGDFGRYPFDYGWSLLRSGLVSIIATDAHSVERRPPRMTAAFAEISRHFGTPVAEKVCLANPQKVWLGERINP